MSPNNPQGLADARKLIAENLKTKDPFLDLGNLGLSDLRELPELLECKHLEGLNLGPWYWKNGELLESKNRYSWNRIGPEGLLPIKDNLINLNSLHLRKNPIKDAGAKWIAENFFKLTTLNLGHSRIGIDGVKEIAEKMPGLTALYLSGNDIGDDGLSVLAKNLKALTSLDLSMNQISDDKIDYLIKNLKSLSYIDLQRNPISRIPSEILGDIKALREYLGIGLDTMEKATPAMQQNNTIKLVLLGNSSAGKTTLAKYLSSDKKSFLKEHNSTHGIQSWIWNFRSGEKDYKVNIRDFGGQDYFHATHNLFLDKESLFLLIHTNESVHIKDCGEEEQFHSPEYWMENIAQMLDNPGLYTFEHAADTLNNTSVIWFVQNKTDHPEYRQEWFPTKAMKKAIPVRGQFHISIRNAAQSGKNKPLDWKIFEDSLKQRIRDLCKTEIPVFWAKIRDEALPEWKKSGRLFFYRDEFSSACKSYLTENEIPFQTERGSFTGLLTYLKGSGELIHFDHSPNLADYVFLGADRLTDYLFNKILTKKVKKQGGEFTAKDISAENPGEAEIFINVLKEFELIFSHPPEGKKFVAPQFLPEDPHMPRFMNLIPLSFAIRFPGYLPRHIITRFISRFAIENNTPHYWKNGILFKRGDVHCLVRADLKDQIIHVHAEDKKEKFKALKYIFEFLTRSCYGLPVQLSVKDKTLTEPSGKITKGILSSVSVENPYLQPLELSTNGIQFASVGNLRKAIENKAQKIASDSGSYMDLNATYYQLLGSGMSRPKRVFLSYAHADEEHLNDLKAHMSAPAMSGLIDVWHDRKIDGGEAWDDVIRLELKNADIVLLLLSHNFMKSRYIWETEIPIAKSAGAIIVPIFLNPVYFKEKVYSLFEKQGLPNDTRWILGNSWQNKHQAYMEVVEGIVELLKE